jgi:hypothetical protein
MTNERIAFDELPNGYRVSTVFLGDMYETMVFPRGSWLDVACRRTRSRVTALHEHRELVAEWTRAYAPAQED